MAKAPAKPRKRRSAAANATAPASLVTSALPAITVRHYCQGIGDSHWDHVSGFTSAAEIFDKNKFAVDEVWMAWSENPRDPDAIAFDKFKVQALSALQGASAKLDAIKGINSYMGGLRDGLNSVLGFQFGAAGEKVRAARDAAEALSKKQPPVYMGRETAPFSIPGLPNIRIYVLGPPRSNGRKM